MPEKLTSQEIREIFLGFFEKHSHTRIKGSSLIPHNDPTLLYVNSGMAPLKKYFTGESEPPNPDLCNVQPCIRTRDIEDVGDRHHLTFFEMMGSWSINHYFKERAIELAFELLTEKFGLPTAKLYATVYKGDPELNLAPDTVSACVWEKMGLKPHQIVFLGQDNFWGPAGESGPCGPCTEVFYDTGSEYGEQYQPGKHFDTARRYIEIWNAGVFMEFDKKADGTFSKLHFNSVDTGSGLERMTMTMNGYSSVYETDLLRPILTVIGNELGRNESSEADRRVLADHLRASTFILAEGIVPSNEGRGYIPRRLIRKCIAIATRAGATSFNFNNVIDEILHSSGANYPILASNRQQIIETFNREKKDFQRVVSKGLERLNRLCKEPPFTLSGKEAFALSATYGMPLELIRDFVREKGGALEQEEFEHEFRKHQEISRALGNSEAALQKNPAWPKADGRFALLPSLGADTEFLGYEQTDGAARVIAIFEDGNLVEAAETGLSVEVITDKTPFYAEGGGQVGDQGEIESEDGLRIEVSDCIKVGQSYHVHRGQVVQGNVTNGQTVQLKVDVERREHIKRNHSATHLLHGALRTILGEHAKQSGSLVEAARFRFDFQHPGKLTPEELMDIERLVNQYVRENISKETLNTTYDQAIKEGALAFFGDNYGSSVRLVRFGSASAELCGGTHVNATGDIGLFRIVSESGVASGVRRIVAVTGEAAVEYTLQREQILRDVATRLRVGAEEIPERIDKLVRRPAQGSKQDNQQKLDINQQIRSLANGPSYLISELDLGAAELREEALRINHDVVKGITCLIGKEDGRVRIVVTVDRHWTRAFSANTLLGELVPFINGKGGGQKELAQGGGDNVLGIERIVSEFPSVLERVVSSLN